jgi:hypothetical protein
MLCMGAAPRLTDADVLDMYGDQSRGQWREDEKSMRKRKERKKRREREKRLADLLPVSFVQDSC